MLHSVSVLPVNIIADNKHYRFSSCDELFNIIYDFGCIYSLSPSCPPRKQHIPKNSSFTPLATVVIRENISMKDSALFNIRQKCFLSETYWLSLPFSNYLCLLVRRSKQNELVYFINFSLL